MLRKTLATISVLMMIAHLSPVFAKSISTKRFLACESGDLKIQQLNVAIDKEYKQDEPDMEKISNMEKNLAFVERFATKHCSDLTASN